MYNGCSHLILSSFVCKCSLKTFCINKFFALEYTRRKENIFGALDRLFLKLLESPSNRCFLDNIFLSATRIINKLFVNHKEVAKQVTFATQVNLVQNRPKPEIKNAILATLLNL